MFFRSVSFFRLWCWETSVLHLKVENVFKLASVHNQLKGNLQKKQKLVFKKVALLIVCDKWDRNQSVWSVLISVSHWLAQTSSSKILICKKSSNARKQSVQQSDQRQHYFCSWPPPRADKPDALPPVVRFWPSLVHIWLVLVLWVDRQCGVLYMLMPSLQC